jgi:signal transduction histidine kinase
VRLQLLVGVALLVVLAIDGVFHLRRLEQARTWQASLRAVQEVELVVLSELHDALQAPARPGAHRWWPGVQPTPPPGGPEILARLHEARGRLAAQAALAPGEGSRLVEVGGEPFLVIEAASGPPVVVWWAGLADRAEIRSGAVLSLGERPAGAVPVLEGVLTGAPVWLRLQQAPSGVVPFRGLLAGAGALLVLEAGVKLLLARVRERAAERAKEALLQRLSHELRTPAAAVQALAEALRSGAAAGQERAFLELLEQEARRLGHGLDSVLRAAQGQEPVRDGARVPLELREGVERLAARWRPRLQEVTVEGEGPAWVSACPAELEEALEALLDNAVVHGAPPYRISVEVGPERVVVTVQDGGPGIAPSERARVLQRGEGRHTGLGLWVASEVARHHGGTLQIGDSAHISLSLPRKTP